MPDPIDNAIDLKRPDTRPETTLDSSPDSPSEGPTCPRCGGSVTRVPRHLTDRLRSLVSPVRRYRCRSLVCQWSGTLPHEGNGRDNAAGEAQRSAGTLVHGRPAHSAQGARGPGPAAQANPAAARSS
jgi:hypothetical protein